VKLTDAQIIALQNVSETGRVHRSTRVMRKLVQDGYIESDSPDPFCGAFSLTDKGRAALEIALEAM